MAGLFGAPPQPRRISIAKAASWKNTLAGEEQKVTIRAAREDDLDAVKGLLAQSKAIHFEERPDLFTSGAQKYSDDELRGYLAAGDCPAFVAVNEAGKIVGCILTKLLECEGTEFQKARRTLALLDIVVADGARHGGVGTKLFERFEAEAVARDCDDMRLQVWSFNRNAREFYKSQGFEPLSVNMEKVLKAAEPEEEPEKAEEDEAEEETAEEAEEPAEESEKPEE